MAAVQSNSLPPQSGRISERIISDAPTQSFAFDLWAVVKMAVILGLVAYINRVQFPDLLRRWNHDVNWSHGLLIPLFSIYLIYVRFREIVAVERKVCWAGLPLVLLFCVLQTQAYRWQNNWSCQVTMTMLVASLVLFLAGWGMFKLLWLPILFLIFAYPIPDALYADIALTLQNIATVGGAWLLRVFGVELTVSGSSMYVTPAAGGDPIPLRVEEACAGVRLLMAFLALSVAMAYITDRPVWQRIVLVLMGIPVAIASNVIRVAVTCTAFVFGHEEWGKDFMHSFTGVLTLIPAVLMLWLIAKLMDCLFVEVDDDEEEAPGPIEAPAVSAEDAS